jgi:lysyl oxidase
MRILALALLIPACADPLDQGTTTAASSKPPIDVDGMPDLYVREDILSKKWIVGDTDVVEGSCEAIEGNITPGTHRVVRFAVGTANIGDADLVVGDPNDAVNQGLFEFAACHHHYHFRNYAKYELVDPSTGATWRAAKRGFCMIDIDKNPKELGAPDRPRIFDSCGAVGVPGFQGISRGWTDTYDTYLTGQYFVLDGGDGQAPVPPGTYLLRITANPPFKATGGEVCPHTDSNRMCHMLPESNYFNNVTQISVPL